MERANEDLLENLEQRASILIHNYLITFGSKLYEVLMSAPKHPPYLHGLTQEQKKDYYMFILQESLELGWSAENN